MVVTSKPANRNQSGQGSYSALRRAPASIIFWGSYFSVRGYGRLTLPGRRIRQRWEATGAPAQRLTGPGGNTTRLLAPVSGKALNPRGLGTGPHVKGFVFLFERGSMALLLRRQGRFGAPAARAAFQHVAVMQQAVKHGTDGSGVTKHFAPVLYRSIRS